MTETIDELGPVDYVVIEFPGNKFNGEMAPALGDLIERKLVKVLDLVFLTKDADGSIEGLELEDLDPDVVGEIEKLEVDIAHLLSEDDLASVAAALEPNSSAAVLVWENAWAAPFASAVRESGGQLVASGRIPIHALVAALEADAEDQDNRGMSPFVKSSMEHERRMLSRCATGDGRLEADLDRQPRFATLDPKADALVRISALVALGAPRALCRDAIVRALEAGASGDDVVATLITISPIVGSSRAVSAAPEIALAMGYDIDAAVT